MGVWGEGEEGVEFLVEGWGVAVGFEGVEGVGGV